MTERRWLTLADARMLQAVQSRPALKLTQTHIQRERERRGERERERERERT